MSRQQLILIRARSLENARLISKHYGYNAPVEELSEHLTLIDSSAEIPPNFESILFQNGLAFSDLTRHPLHPGWDHRVVFAPGAVYSRDGTVDFKHWLEPVHGLPLVSTFLASEVLAEVKIEDEPPMADLIICIATKCGHGKRPQVDTITRPSRAFSD